LGSDFRRGICPEGGPRSPVRMRERKEKGKGSLGHFEQQASGKKKKRRKCDSVVLTHFIRKKKWAGEPLGKPEKKERGKRRGAASLFRVSEYKKEKGGLFSVTS